MNICRSYRMSRFLKCNGNPWEKKIGTAPRFSQWHAEPLRPSAGRSLHRSERDMHVMYFKRGETF